MSTDYNNFSLNKGKAGKIDLESLKGGMRREQLKGDKNLLAIFDALDDGSGVLDADEVVGIKELFKKYAKNTNLSKKEANKLLQALFEGKKDIQVTNDDLFNFVNGLDNNSRKIKQSKVIEENGHKIVQTEYTNGVIEKFNEDEQKRILIKDNHTYTFDKNGKLLSREFFDEDGNAIKLTYEEDKVKKSIKYYKDNSGIETIEYEDEKPKVKTVQKGSDTEIYSYKEDGTELLSKKIEGGQRPEDRKVTEYTYNEDGTVEETLTQADSTTVTVKKDNKVHSTSTTRTDGDNTVETIVDENGNVTENILNSEGKRLKQTKKNDGKEYSVEYDGNGNTIIIVQNGESIRQIAKKFGVSAEDIEQLNDGKLKVKGNTKFFRVGEDIRIPKELEADDAALKGRKSREETIEDYNQDALERKRKQEELRQKEEEDKRLQEEAANRKLITFTSGQKTFEELARQLFKQEGNENPSDREVQLRTEEIKKHNPKIKDGELQGKKVKAGVADETYNRVVGRQKEIAEINKNVRINNTGKDIAEKLYKVCDDNAAAVNKKEFWNQLNRINSDNVIAVLDNYDKVVEKHTEDSSLVDTICSEVGASEGSRKKALTHILNNMAAAAKKAGVSDKEIQHAKKQFTDSMKEEFADIGRINPSNMEKALDFLRGAAVSAKLSGSVAEISTEEAMDKFLNGQAVEGENGGVSKSGGLVDTDKDAQKTYRDAREAEGWVAKTGDWVCGLFGCTTIDDMDKKLGAHAADVKKLVAAAENKDEAGFKKLYKDIFGIDFNPKAIAARETARENFETASVLDSSRKAFTSLETKTKNMDYNGIRNELKNSFNFNDSEIDALVDAYAETKGVKITSDSDKKFVLDSFIKDSKQKYLQEYQKLAKGKTLEQMSKDVELLTKSAYGTNDIVKDVIKFNENQQLTDTITTAALEIAGTVALQFVPGLGQIAAARLAVSAAKWGAKGVKVANMAMKAGNAAAAVQKVQTASKKAQIAAQVLNAGAATAAVNLSNKKSVEETLKKTLMNMSFAGVGAGSSVLAPKLMKSFGIVDKALANEIAEEIINVAGSYGVTKISGSDYGKVDGFIDFASGLIISRLSHVKVKPSTGSGDVPPIVPPKPDFEGGGQPSKPSSDSDLPSRVDGPDNKHGQTTDKPEIPDPTPENPLEMELWGEKIDVVKIETNKQGQKILHTDGGFKITLDKHDRPIIAKDNEGNTGFFEYANSSDTMPSKSTKKDKKNQVLQTVEEKNGVKVTKEYDSGQEFIIDNDGNIISERYLPLSEYPADAKIPDPDVYSSNMKKQIEECTSLDKLNELKYEYSMYNSQYGKTEDLFKLFNEKNLELNTAGTTTVKPHQPKSKLITGTALDDALKNFNMKKYGKKGLPLKYSHDKFITDLNNKLKSLPDAERAQIMKELNLKMQTDAGGKLELVDIPTLSAKPSSEAAQKVLDILNKYAKQNEIQISDPALKAELENFIKDVPEFSFMIGKQQNSNHSYSLDSHTLQNLQKTLKYADEANLSDESKEILKMSVMLHDMGKQFKGSGVSDTGHAILSKQYAKDILERFDYPQAKKDKILNLIENHHWFKEFNKGNMSADDVVKMFGEDLAMAKVMAKADLESVSDDFHLTILEPGKKLSPAEYEKKINDKLNSIDNVVSATLIGQDLPIGSLQIKEPYILDFNKIDKLKIGNVEVDINDPQLKKLIDELKEGDGFAIGCNNPPTVYNDVKYKVGTYADGVGSHHVVISKKHGELVITAHKDNVSVIKNIPTKANPDPVISKKIDQLRKQASSITSETFTVNGKPVQFEILNGTQGGSNKGYYVINKETGELFYAKFGGPQGKTELLATKLYEMAGVDVPEMNSFKSTDGSVGTLSKYIPDLQKVNQATAHANDGFGMDVLLANWDVVGLSGDNMMKTADGKIIRLDNGGAFDYRAQGANKPYNSVPIEITTLLDPNINSKSATVFSKMTRDDMIKSLNKAVSLKDSEITKLLENMGLTQYKEPLLARKKFLKSILEEMKATPQGSDSMLTYMTKVKDKTLNKFIDNAKSVDELNDVKAALHYIKDDKVKAGLIDKINNREKYLNTFAPKLQQLSEVQVNNLLAKNGFVKNSYGGLSKQLTDVEKQKLYDLYGSYGSTIINKIQQPLTSSDIANIRQMLNVANGKYISMWQKDMNALIHLYRNIQGSGALKASPEQWEAIFNIAKAKPITADQLSDMGYYKGSGYHTINGLLTENKKLGKIIPPNIQSKINNIQDYINTQVLTKPIKVVRGEGPEVLASVKLKSGKTLDQAMAEAKQHYINSGSKQDRSKIDALIDEVLDNNYVATQERFMSTALKGCGGGFSGEIKWELEIQKGSKGVFLEGINVNGANQCECEFLVQKDSKIVITGIDFKNGHWKLEGSVSN